MNLEQFWELMERTHKESGGIPERQHDLLVQALVGMSVQDIIDYERIYEKLERRADTNDMLNAAYIMNDCSDDKFTDFRGWLMCQGKTVYENALRDPDTLANVVSVEGREQCIWESLAYVAYHAYEQKTGTDDGFPNKANAEDAIWDSSSDSVLTRDIPQMYPGEECRKYYPKLWAKFGFLHSGYEEANQP